MAVLDPDELFEQAELLIAPRRPGPPRQVDVRRAISASYYGVFHFVCTEVADLFVGKKWRQDPRYSRVYRSVDHGVLGSTCRAIPSRHVDATIIALAPTGFSPALRQFAAGVIELKAQRHHADYEPAGLLYSVDARVAVSIGRRALAAFRSCSSAEQAAFLTLLAFKSR